MSKTQKEIGGYLELEHFSGSLYHDNALALSSGRACLAYLIEQRHIDKMLLPDLLCDVVAQVCAAYGVQVRYYAVGPDLRPAAIGIDVLFVGPGPDPAAAGQARRGSLGHCRQIP